MQPGTDPIRQRSLTKGDSIPRSFLKLGLRNRKPQCTWAQCRGGRLYVEAQLDNAFSAYSMGNERNYHGLDYALFYMDVRENAQRRVEAYLAKVRGEG